MMMCSCVLDFSLDSQIQSTVYDGTFLNNSASSPQPQCLTGNCTWPLFSSLAFCSTCQPFSWQSSSEVCNHDGSQCNYTLPSGVNVNYTDSTVVALYATSGNSTDNKTFPTVAGIHNPLVALGVLKWDDNHDEHQPVEASECSIYVCVNTYNVSMNQGILRSAILKKWYNHSINLDWTHDASETAILTPPPKDLSSATADSDFAISNFAPLVSYLTGLLEGALDGKNTLDASDSNTATLVQAIHNGAKVTSSVVENIALVVTNAMRSANGTYDAVTGSAWERQTFIHVRWIWLTLPVLLVFSSLFLLISVMLESWGQGVTVWKSSALAVIFHGLDKEDDLPVNKLSEMKHAAKKTKVRLQRAAGRDWKLVERRT